LIVGSMTVTLFLPRLNLHDLYTILNHGTPLMEPAWLHLVHARSPAPHRQGAAALHIPGPTHSTAAHQPPVYYLSSRSPPRGNVLASAPPSLTANPGGPPPHNPGRTYPSSKSACGHRPLLLQPWPGRPRRPSCLPRPHAPPGGASPIPDHNSSPHLPPHKHQDGRCVMPRPRRYRCSPPALLLLPILRWAARRYPPLHCSRADCGPIVCAPSDPCPHHPAPQPSRRAILPHPDNGNSRSDARPGPLGRGASR